MDWLSETLSFLSLAEVSFILILSLDSVVLSVQFEHYQNQIDHQTSQFDLGQQQNPKQSCAHCYQAMKCENRSKKEKGKDEKG